MMLGDSNDTNETEGNKYEIGEKSINQIKIDGIKDSPQNYEFWHSYYSKSSFEIIREVDRLRLKRERFFCVSEKSKAPEKAGEVLRRAAEILNSMLIGEGRFSSALAIFGTVLDTAKTEDELRVAARVMAREAANLIAEKHSLSSDLHSLTEETNALRSDVERLKALATTDKLTGLSNRRALDEIIYIASEEANRTSNPLSVALIDIDNFKKFNDSFGHDVGDAILKIVANLIRSTVTKNVFAARNGGDEFALLMPGHSKEMAISIISNMCTSIASKEVRSKGSGQLYGSVTLSCGVTTYLLKEDIKETLKRADNALYEAKRLGRNRVCSF